MEAIFYCHGEVCVAPLPPPPFGGEVCVCDAMLVAGVELSPTLGPNVAPKPF